MKYYFLILSFTVLAYLPGSAQEMDGVQKQQNLEAIGNPGNQGVVQSFDNRYEGVRGNPYLLEDWIKGEIIMRDSSVHEGIPLRYDVYTDELLAKRNNKIEIVIDKNQIRGFQLGKPGIPNFARFIKAVYLKDFKEVAPDRFVQVLYDGPTALYAIKKKNLIKANYQGAYSPGRNYDEFTDAVSKFYIRTPTGKFAEIKPKEKAVMKILSDEKKKVEEFIKKNNLILEEATDLVKVVMFYDQLHS
jgi:hypothetical protein